MFHLFCSSLPELILPRLRGMPIDNQEGYMLAKALSGALLGIDAVGVISSILKEEPAA